MNHDFSDEHHSFRRTPAQTIRCGEEFFHSPSDPHQVMRDDPIRKVEVREDFFWAGQKGCVASKPSRTVVIRYSPDVYTFADAKDLFETYEEACLNRKFFCEYYFLLTNDKRFWILAKKYEHR